VLPEIAGATAASPAPIGAIVATFPLGMLIGFAGAGHAVRRHGTRGTILAALMLVALGCAGFLAGRTLGAFAVARFLMGIGSGGLWIGIAFATLERWPGHEYLCMSRVFASYAAGGLISPLLGAIEGVDGPFLGYLGLVAAAIVPTALLGRPRSAATFASDQGALRLRGFRLASAAILFTVLGLGVVEVVLPLHLAARLEQTEIGVAYACVSVVVTATSTAAARYAPTRNLVAALVLVTAGVAVAGATSGIALWIAALLIAGTGIGLGNTGSIGLLLAAVPVERIVTAMIAWSQIGILGYLLGPVAGGFVVDSWGFAALGLVPLGAAMAVLALMRRPRTASRASVPTLLRLRR
jgi:MFS family permease